VTAGDRWRWLLGAYSGRGTSGRAPVRRTVVWRRRPTRSSWISAATHRIERAGRDRLTARRIPACLRQKLRATRPAISHGTACSRPARGKRTSGGRKSIETRRETIRRPARHSGHGGDGSRAHNTLSPETTHVQVFYPFHPLLGATLQIVRKPKRGDGAVSIIEPTGRRLKIPVWMLLPECAEIRIAERPRLSREALLSLTSLLPTRHNPKAHGRDNLLQTAIDGCEGGRCGATKTSGPDDPKAKRSRADGRKGTRRSDRSHGPNSGGGVSSGRRKN
jgi:hypothetical protein